MSHRFAHKDLKNRGFLRLFVAKYLIQASAVSIASLFIPIFLYTQFGENFTKVGLYYATLSFFYVLLLVPGMYLINKIGLRWSLTFSGVMMMAIFSLMYLMSNSVEYVGTLIPILITLNIAYATFHWVPIHVDFASLTNKQNRGWRVGLTLAMTMFLGVVGPILSGYIITTTGYQTLFLITIVLALCATVAYSLTPEIKIHFDWSWRKTWRSLFSKEMRGLGVAQFANGAETIINIVVWPIFLYHVLSGDIFEIGSVSTIVVGATVILQLLLGRKLDQKITNKQHTLKTGSILYAMGWILKMFVLSALHVFLVGLYHNITKIFIRTPFDTILYEITSDQGSYIDEFSTLREMAFHSGRVFAMLFSVLLVAWLGINWTFLVAATASITLNFIYRQKANIV